MKLLKGRDSLVTKKNLRKEIDRLEPNRISLIKKKKMIFIENDTDDSGNVGAKISINTPTVVNIGSQPKTLIGKKVIKNKKIKKIKNQIKVM